MWGESADDGFTIWRGHGLGGDVNKGVGAGLHVLVFEESVSAFVCSPGGDEEVEVAVEVDVSECGGHAAGDAEDVVDSCGFCDVGEREVVVCVGT